VPDASPSGPVAGGRPDSARAHPRAAAYRNPTGTGHPRSAAGGAPRLRVSSIPIPPSTPLTPNRATGAVLSRLPGRGGAEGTGGQTGTGVCGPVRECADAVPPLPVRRMVRYGRPLTPVGLGGALGPLGLRAAKRSRSCASAAGGGPSGGPARRVRGGVGGRTQPHRSASCRRVTGGRRGTTSGMASGAAGQGAVAGGA